MMKNRALRIKRKAKLQAERLAAEEAKKPVIPPPKPPCLDLENSIPRCSRCRTKNLNQYPDKTFYCPICGDLEGQFEHEDDRPEILMPYYPFGSNQWMV